MSKKYHTSSPVLLCDFPQKIFDSKIVSKTNMLEELQFKVYLAIIQQFLSAKSKVTQELLGCVWDIRIYSEMETGFGCH